MKNPVASEYAKGARFAVGALAVFVAYSLAGAAFTAVSTVSTGSGLKSTDWNAMVADLNDLNTRVTAISGVPTGTVIAYNGTSCPTGWTEAAGSSVPAGPGGSTTLNLRGQFVRGWNSTAAGLDASRGFGSSQNGSLVMNDVPQTQRVFSLVGTSLFYDSPQLNPSANYGWTNYSPGTNITGNWGLGTVDANYVGATRPTNVALLYCVKN